MIILFQLFPFALTFFLLFILKGKSVYYFIPINIYFDAIVGFFPENTSFGILRAIILGLLILSHPKVIKDGIAYIIYFLLVYWFLLVFLSSNIAYSFKVYLQVFFTMVFYPIGYAVANSKFDFKHFSYSIVFSSILLLLNFILSNVLGIGENPYGEDLIYSGNLQTTSLYIISYIVLAFPFVIPALQKFKISRYAYLGSIFSLVIILLMFGRRSPIVAILLGVFVLFLFYYRNNLRKIILPAMASVFLVIVLGFVFMDKITKTYMARESRFEQSFYENELRYIETQLIWMQYLSFSDPVESFIGKEIFNTIGNYGNGMFGDRPIHVDYNRVLHGSGFIGLILYLALLVFIGVRAINRYYFTWRSGVTRNPSIYPSSIITSYGIMIFLMLIFFSFSGGLSGVTFRSYTFFMLGFSLNFPIYLNEKRTE